MPLNIFEGLDLDFDKWIFIELKESQRLAFFELHDTFFPTLEYATSSRDKEFNQLLKEAKKDSSEYDNEKTSIVLPVASEEDYDESVLVETRKWDLAGKFAYREGQFELPDSWTLLRFLQADNYNCSRARSRLIKTVIWRRANKIYEFDAENPPEEQETYGENRILRFITTDFDGQLIMVERFGETLAFDNLSVMSMDKWISCIIYEAEHMTLKLREQTKLLQRPMHKIISVYDMSGFRLLRTLRNIKFIRKLDQVLSPNYPELVDKIIIVNASSTVSRGYNRFIKLFLDKSTAEKVQIQGSVIKRRVAWKKKEIEVSNNNPTNTEDNINIRSIEIDAESQILTNTLNTSMNRNRRTFFTRFRRRKKRWQKVVLKQYNNKIFQNLCEVEKLPICYGGKADDIPHRKQVEANQDFVDFYNLEEITVASDRDIEELGLFSGFFSVPSFFSKSRGKRN